MTDILFYLNSEVAENKKPAFMPLSDTQEEPNHFFIMLTLFHLNTEQALCRFARIFFFCVKGNASWEFCV